MKKIIVILIVLGVLLGGAFAYRTQTNETGTPGDVVENPDGSDIVATLNNPFKIKNHTITAWAVTEDSRCASDVQCIQAGRVKVALNVVSPSGSSTTELEPGKTYTTETIAITLDKVEPYPVSTHKITDAEYRFYFTVRDHQSGL